MNWDSFFDDLSGQLESEMEAEVRDLATDERRLVLAKLSVRDRLHAIFQSQSLVQATEPVRLELNTGRLLAVRFVSLGRDWISADAVQPPPSEHLLIPVRSIRTIELDRQERELSMPRPEESESLSRQPRISHHIGFAFVLRDLARRRRQLRLTNNRGEQFDGVLDHVGADHLDFCTSEGSEDTAGTRARRWRIVPLAHVSCIELL